MKNILTFSTLLFLLFSTTVFGEVNIYPPTLRTPDDGGKGLPTDVLLDWDAVTGETLNITYEVQLATDADFTDPFFVITPLTAIQTENLLFGNTYYWKVRAFDDGSPSDWTETRTFTTTNTVVFKTNPGPKIGAMVYADPLISWEKITGLTGFLLQVDTTYQFAEDNSGTGETLNATFVSEAGDKWAVGDGGTVLHFDTAQWVTVDVGTTANLNDVHFLAEDDGYVIGDGGVMVHFDGTSWNVVDLGTSENLNGIAFVDAGTGWVVGDGGLTVRYTDGSWTEETTGNSNDLFDIYALSPVNVWACGASKTVIHFNGTEWSGQEVGTKDYYSIWFADENNGWVAGKSGKIFYFNGLEWVEQSSATTKDLYSISFANGFGYAVGKSGTMLFYTGEWTLMASGFSDNIFGIYSSGINTVYAGTDGLLASSTGGGFDSPYLLEYDVPFDSGSYQVSNLLFGKTFYYRMRAVHAVDSSEWSGPWSMTTYAAPELDKPNNNSSDTDLEQLFKWDLYEGATDYVFQIGADENFDVSWSIPLDSNSLEFTTVLFGHDFFWRVHALHPVDISDWSEVWSFTTVNTVSLDLPEDNAEDVNTCPKFVWEKINGVPKYEIYIDADENFSDPVSAIVNTNLSQCQESMERNTIYYWKVRAISGIDSSGWSATWSFKTEGYIGVDENVDARHSIRVYPNPSNGEFSLTINSLSGEVYQLSVTDLTGKALLEREVICTPGENKVNVQLGELDKGIYLVNVRNSSQVVTEQLMIK
ncbi:MAG: T9SS type A sorting domain-containing protein [Bacteroidales bacterium]|nr:T9SS type A sorting domain-containing protein [Bacteroidales bacterium]